MSKHTPGPLLHKTNRHPETNGEKWGWVDIPAPGINVTWTNNNPITVANARLIAAAPEMLIALKAIQANWKLLNDEHFSGVAEKLFTEISKITAKAEGTDE